jgi:hypothetical protein
MQSIHVKMDFHVPYMNYVFYLWINFWWKFHEKNKFMIWKFMKFFEGWEGSKGIAEKLIGRVEQLASLTIFPISQN